SLVKAGLLPILTRPRVIEHVIGWRRAVFKPSVGEQTLLAGFASALLEEASLPHLADTGARLEELLRDPPALSVAIVDALDRATKTQAEINPIHDPGGTVKLVVVCDQFEEIFDERVTASDRTDFCEAIRTLVLTNRVWVIATLRADFY